MTTTVEPDGALGPARRRLDDAVQAIADPIPAWISGVCRWQDSLYTRLRVELAGGRVMRRAQVHQSRLPCHTAILAWLVEVDGTVAKWAPEEKGSTIERLRTGRAQLAAAGRLDDRASL